MGIFQARTPCQREKSSLAPQPKWILSSLYPQPLFSKVGGGESSQPNPPVSMYGNVGIEQLKNTWNNGEIDTEGVRQSTGGLAVMRPKGIPYEQLWSAEDVATDTVS